MQMKPQDGNTCLPSVVLSSLPSRKVKHKNEAVKLPMNLCSLQEESCHAGHVLCFDTAILHQYSSCMETSKYIRKT